MTVHFTPKVICTIRSLEYTIKSVFGMELFSRCFIFLFVHFQIKKGLSQSIFSDWDVPFYEKKRYTKKK